MAVGVYLQRIFLDFHQGVQQLDLRLPLGESLPYIFYIEFLDIWDERYNFFWSISDHCQLPILRGGQ